MGAAGAPRSVGRALPPNRPCRLIPLEHDPTAFTSRPQWSLRRRFQDATERLRYRLAPAGTPPPVPGLRWGTVSQKRNQNKTLHQKRRGPIRPQATRPRREGPEGDSIWVPVGPTEFDQMSVLIDERSLGMPQTTLSDLRAVARTLPFEGAMLSVALLNQRTERVLDDAVGQWDLAHWFYEGWPEVLDRIGRLRARASGRPIFSPQAAAMLMRILIEEAEDKPFAQLNPSEFHRLQRAVLGAHTVLDDTFVAPSTEAIVAYELQASSFFNRPPVLEEMVRADDLLQLMESDELRAASDNYVPVDEWLRANGMTAEEQRVLGFAFSALTNAFGDGAPTPIIKPDQIDELLSRLGLADTPRDFPMIAASRAELRASFESYGGGDSVRSWEFRPFKSAPFLRFADGDLLLLGAPWILSWLGEGFHYRAHAHAKTLGDENLLMYSRYMGEAVERYTIDLAHAAIDGRATVLGEQSYGKGGGKKTSDVAVVWGKDLILFEVHARRITGNAMATGELTAALGEVTKLIVGKINRIAVCIDALLAGTASLPGVELDSIERIWPVVVPVGHLMQTQPVWKYIRDTVKETTSATLAKPRVQPLQVLDIADYERLLGIVEAGSSLPWILERKSSGPFRERDLAAWLHGASDAPSDESRLSVLEKRWDAMSIEVSRTSQVAAKEH
jgi:hypothetical protein